MVTEVNLNITIDEAPVSECEHDLGSYDVYPVKIAGINYSNDVNDQSKWGLIGGYCMRDTGNKYDKKAIGLYSAEGHLYGYVPSEELADFIEWNKNRRFPFVGKMMPFVNDNGKPMLKGYAYVIKPYEDNQDVAYNAIMHYKDKLADMMAEDLREFRGDSGDIRHKPASNPSPTNSGCMVLLVFLVVFGLALLTL